MVLDFTDKEIKGFLLKKGFVVIKKDGIETEYVSDIIGAKHKILDKFNELIKKRLLE
jgi:hypothetical protein